MSTEPIRPLHDVWLRPRRVFRELAERPVGRVDWILAAAQGVVEVLEFFRTRNVGATNSLSQIFGSAFLVGSVVGVASLYIMTAIYSRVAGLSGSPPVRRQLIHVLAYSGVPMAAALAIWIVAALLAGETTFTMPLQPNVETFVVILLRVQFCAYVFLVIWSLVLQVMGFSEILGIATRKAFGIWVMGQLVSVLAALFLMILIATLFPGVT
jgi:Yip1 domain